MNALQRELEKTQQAAKKKEKDVEMLQMEVDQAHQEADGFVFSLISFLFSLQCLQTYRPSSWNINFLKKRHLSFWNINKKNTVRNLLNFRDFSETETNIPVNFRILIIKPDIFLKIAKISANDNGPSQKESIKNNNIEFTNV